MPCVRFVNDVQDHHIVPVEKLNTNQYEANLGFVQACHTYEAQFRLPVHIPVNVAYTHADIELLKLKPVDGTSTDVSIKFGAVPHRGEEHAKIELGDVTVFIKMNVLAEYDGTPMLREGVKLLGCPPDQSVISEAADLDKIHIDDSEPMVVGE